MNIYFMSLFCITSLLIFHIYLNSQTRHLATKRVANVHVFLIEIEILNVERSCGLAYKLYKKENLRDHIENTFYFDFLNSKSSLSLSHMLQI
jgi:hypothetical protein